MILLRPRPWGHAPSSWLIISLKLLLGMAAFIYSCWLDTTQTQNPPPNRPLKPPKEASPSLCLSPSDPCLVSCRNVSDCGAISMSKYCKYNSRWDNRCLCLCLKSSSILFTESCQVLYISLKSLLLKRPTISKWKGCKRPLCFFQ